MKKVLLIDPMTMPGNSSDLIESQMGICFKQVYSVNFLS